MKKIFKMFMMCFCIILFSSCAKQSDNTVFKPEKTVEDKVDSVYFISNPVPIKAIDFVKDNFEKDVRIKNKHSDVLVTEPYSIAENIYFFPVMQEGKIILSYMVIDENGKLSFQTTTGNVEDYINKDIINNNGIYEITYKQESSESRPEPNFKKVTKEEIPSDKMTYNIKNPILTISKDKLK